MSTTETSPASLAQATVPARPARRPVGLLAASAGIALLLAIPLIFLLIESHRAGFDAVWDGQAQLDRALDGLVADGLVDPLPDGRFALPGPARALV